MSAPSLNCDLPQAMPPKKTKRTKVTKPRPQRAGWVGSAQRASKTPMGRALLGAGESGLNMLLPGSGSALRAGLRAAGFGAYRVGGQPLRAAPNASVRSQMDCGIRIVHHEFVEDVSSSVAFSTRTYPLNPGLFMYRWLSRVAGPFQKYRLNSWCYYFKSTAASALNSTNTAFGFIGGAVEYNVYANTPNTKSDLLSIAGARDGKPAEDNIFPVECNPQMTQNRVYYVRDSEVSDDMAKYDHCKFILGTGGSQAVAVIGELHIAYDITLMSPDPSQDPSTSYFRASATNVSGTTSKAGALLDIGQPFVYVSANGLGVSYDSSDPAYTRIKFTGRTGQHYEFRWYLATTSNEAVSFHNFESITGGVVESNLLPNAYAMNCPRLAVCCNVWRIILSESTVPVPGLLFSISGTPTSRCRFRTGLLCWRLSQST